MHVSLAPFVHTLHIRCLQNMLTFPVTNIATIMAVCATPLGTTSMQIAALFCCQVPLDRSQKSSPSFSPPDPLGPSTPAAASSIGLFLASCTQTENLLPASKVHQGVLGAACPLVLADVLETTQQPRSKGGEAPFSCGPQASSCAVGLRGSLLGHFAGQRRTSEQHLDYVWLLH